MKLSYDLHIHSCLSPCGDDDMTPSNIVGMASLKGLDVIALTDHNSCRNCPGFLKIAQEYGILAIPGMELTTMEEVHVLCLFPDLSKALSFDSYVHDHLIPIPNREDIFGHQILYDTDDQICGKEEILLLGSTDIPFAQVYDLVSKYSGIMIPAHVDKNANSLIHNLGFIPPDSRFACAEIKNCSETENIRKAYPYLQKCNIIYDSDAHSLWLIHEPERHLEAKDKTIQSVFKALTAPGGMIWE